MKYQCHKCLKEFSQKSNFEYHMRRIRPCTKTNTNKKRPLNDVRNNSLRNPPISEEILQNPPISEENFKLVIDSNNFTCDHCKKNFSRKDNLKRHIDAKRCKIIKTHKYTSIDYNTDKFNLLYNEHLKTKEELKKLINIITPLENFKKNAPSFSQSIINTNNTQNNITINNIIVNHGLEDVDKLTSDENKQIINSNSEAIYNIVKQIHYNPRLPEYNNIYINNLRSNSIYVMVDGKFVVEDKKTIISDMISRMAQHIENISNQTKPISKKQRQILFDNFNWLKHFDFTDEDVDGNIIKSDKDLIEKYKKIYNKYELLLYNNRHMITNKNQSINNKTNIRNNFIDVLDV
jgi:hypothetical protein